MKSRRWSNRYEELAFNGTPKDAAKTLVKEMDESGFEAQSYCDEDQFLLDEKVVDLIRIASKIHKPDKSKGPTLKSVLDWRASDATAEAMPDVIKSSEGSGTKGFAVLEIWDFSDYDFHILGLCNLPIRYVAKEEDTRSAYVFINTGHELVWDALKTISSVLTASGISFCALEPYQDFEDPKTFEIIAENIGAKSWEEWLKWYSEQDLVYEDEGDLSFDDLDTFDLTTGDDILIGSGLLCAGEAIGLYGDSGIGKSVLVKQWAMCAAAGLQFFRIPTSKPCKVLIFQGENGRRAESEAVQGIRSAMVAADYLSPEHLELVRKNFTVVPAIGYRGNKFMGLLRRKIRQYKPDLVFIDPLLGVADGNLSSQEYMSNILRENIIPMAREFNVGIVVVHHSGKSGSGAKDRSLDEVKNGALGSMDFAASLRAVVGLFPKTADGLTYELVTTKRGGSYLGRKDDQGKAIDSDRFNIRHSPDGVVWIAVDEAQESASTQELELGSVLPKVEAFIKEKGTVKGSDLDTLGNIARGAAFKLVETKPTEFYSYQLVATGSPRVWSTSPEPEENRKKREAKEAKSK